jgi:GrpB-like predicted nucleotidyltransferase (UPF0157 family)
VTSQSHIDRQRRDPIHIVAYDPNWPAAFEEQRSRVESALRPWLVGPVEHVGSTSVPGLAAKPIVDMLARIPDYHTGGIVEAMSGIGWTHAPEPSDGPARKWSFCFPDVGWRTHHLHVFEAVPENWRSLLTFRDHLRTHPGDAVEYGRIKKALAAADAHDRPRYRSGKAPFIEGLLHQLDPSGDRAHGE